MTPSRTTRALARLAWPLTISLCMGLLVGLYSAGLPLQPSSWAAVALGALLVAVLEARLPHRDAWRPRRADLATDAVYMAVVQGLLPVALALFAGTLALRALAGFGWPASQLWPQAWPLAAQVVLMLLAADLLRYVLHVAAHRFAPLWRLHATHHAPARLYWLNVGRFHPLEKSLQYLLDTLPFVVLGVGPEVLAGYLVFYAVNGFFQHCNADVRLGPLNFVISGPELHRWHHSRDADESLCNYGNNLIVWDLIFGTRFLPRDRVVPEVGLPAPREGAGLLLRAHMAWIRLRAWRPLVRAARQPRRTQSALLRRILARNRATRFGREHDFDRIAGYDDYRARVPVQTYESLRPYVEAQERTGRAELTSERPVLYARTSGTTGVPKDVPITARTLREQRHSQALFAFAHWRARPAAFRGRLLAVTSPAVEGRLPGGSPFGSTSGHIYRDMPVLARARYVVPHEVFEVEDYELRYRLVLRLALVCEDVSTMASANPSTFLRLAELLRERRLGLLTEIETGCFHGMRELAPEVRRAVEARLACAPARLRELRDVLRRPAPRIADLWPRLELVATWTGGSCGIALRALREELPARTRVVDLGYLASELHGSVPVDHVPGRCVPTLRDTFFEFVERERWEQGEPRFVLLHELRPATEYYVLVTTSSGLYRYFMNDVVRTSGRFERTPTFEFVQKGGGVTNITGEKLTEGQVVEAVTGAAAELGLAAPFFVVLADAERARYRLLVEVGDRPRASVLGLAARVEERLCKTNVEYAAKRASGRLGPLRVDLLGAGFGARYRLHCMAAGQREAQWKPRVLQDADAFDFGPEGLAP